MNDVPLLDWVPPKPRGATFDEVRDAERLCAQAKRVLVYCLRMDCELHLDEISQATGDPEASVSARLRDIRKAGFNVDRRYIRRGLHAYYVSHKTS